MKNRRGLSSMVGAVFFIIAMTVAISYISFSIETIDQFAQTVMVKSSLNEDRENEDFHVTKATIDGNKFNVTVQNTGNIPITLTRLYIENTTTTATNTNPGKYDLTTNNVVVPGETQYNIGQSLSISPGDNGASYKMTLTTNRGNEKLFSMNSAGDESLYLQLHAMPLNLPSEFSTTLIMEVVNDLTREESLLSLTPKMTISKPGSTQVSSVFGPFPAKVDSLEAGDTVLFKWIYKISGRAGDAVTFTAELENGVPGNSDSQTITIKNVLFAESSGTALTAIGIVAGSNEDILVLHEETVDDFAPWNTIQQLSPSTADTAGMTWNLFDDGKWQGLTQNVTFASGDVNIIAGRWDVETRYFSEPFPKSLMDDTALVEIDNNGRIRNMVMYHFEDDSSTETDSSGNGRTMTLASTPNDPLWSSTSVHSSSGSYLFDGNDYLSSIEAAQNNIQMTDKFTGAWVKVTGGSGTDRTIFSASEDDNGEFYTLTIDSNDDIVYYIFETSNRQLQCKDTTTNVVNGNWHFIAGERTGNAICDIYVNGTSTGSITIAQGNADVRNIDDGYVRIGSNWDNSKGFVGNIDNFFHWNADAFDSTQHMDLFKANFGDKASLLDWNFTRVNSFNTVLHQMINSTENDGLYSYLPFRDAQGQLDPNDGSHPGWTTVQTANHTFYTNAWANFTNGHRLHMDVEMNTTYTGNLGANLRIDHNNYPTILQTNFGGNTFPSFLVYDKSDDLLFKINNVGPDGVWISFAGVKAIFEKPNNGTSYAAPMKFVNQTSPADSVYETNPLQDSLFIPVNGQADVTFWTPRITPCAEGPSQNCKGIEIEAGYYNMYVIITGYDVRGANLFRTFEIGLVKVVD